MSTNLYKAFRALIPSPSLQIGTVVEFEDGTATVELPGGGTLQARGEAAVTDTVFVRNGVIEGPAPNLPVELIEV